MSKAIHLNRDRHCEERKRRSNPGERRAPYGPLDRFAALAMTAPLDRAIPTPSEAEIRRNAEQQKRTHERARCDEATHAAVSSGDGRFRQREKLGPRLSRALHRPSRSVGAQDRRVRHAQPRRRADPRGPLHEPLARRQAALADRRHADRNQGHHRDHRHGDGERFAAVRRLPREPRQRERSGAARGRGGDCRQDRDDRIRLDAAARDEEIRGT